jgi:vacuolar-type H+-ATPase subunit D/Vma8
MGGGVAVILSALCWLSLASPSRAALEPETNEPYSLQIVLQVAPHRTLTPAFRTQLARELRDGLQIAFGDLARVELVNDHPLLKEIEARGLQAVLDGWKEVSPRKTHFVRIDFADDRYQIEAGQHDGLTGLAGPVRRAATADRALVGKTAALLVERDFGLVGTLPPKSQGTEVNVVLKGSGLGVPLDRWLRKDEVFALARIVKVGDRLESERVPWALLRIRAEPKGNTCRCQLLHRYRHPLAEGPNLVGYRCLKLGTTQAPLNLRFVDEQTLTPRSGLRVEVSRDGFGPKDAVHQEGTTNPDGTLPLRRDDNRYAHVAFVRVSVGGSVIAQMPVEILDDRPVVCRLRVDARAEAWGELEQQRKRWLGRLNEVLLVQENLRQELGELIRKGAHAQARERAAAGLKALEESLASLAGEAGQLQAAARELGPERPLSLAEGQRRLDAIRVWEANLRDSIASLDQVLKEKSDPKQKEFLALVEQARRLEDRAEYDEAIRTYQRALAVVASPKVQDRLNRLQAQWKPKNEAHARARDFIYLAWPRLDSARKLKEHLADARAALQTCRAAADPLAPEKLLLAGIAHADRLQKEFEALRSQNDEDARNRIKTIEEVAGELEQFLKEVNDYLQTARAAR